MIVPTHFDEDALWSPRQEAKKGDDDDQWATSYTSYEPYRFVGRGDKSPRYPDVLDEAIRRARGEIGLIIRRLIPDDDEMTGNSWGRSGWQRYPFALLYPTEGVVEELEAYADLDPQLPSTDKAIRQLVRQIAQAEAQQKWDEL